MNLLTHDIDSKAMTIFDVQKVRADFPILSRLVKNHPLVYLDNGASSQKPIQVIQAISEYYKHSHANVHRGVHTLSQEATDAYEKARIQCQEFLNASSSEEIIFTKGTTDSINLVAHGFGMKFLEGGDEVLISGMEHHANIVPWQLVCEMKGAHLRVIPVEEDGSIDIEKYTALLSEKTKIISVVHISNTLGTLNPVKEMIQLAHQRNIPVCIDGAQAAPHMRLDVQNLGADFYAFSGHKMYGPTGIGVLYGKKNWLDKMNPYQGGGDMIDQVTFEKTTYAELPFKYEAGTPNIAGAIGLATAIQYIHDLGYEGIKTQEQSLLKYATEQLSLVDKVRIIGTAPQKASVISFVIEGTHPYDVGTILDHLGIAVRTGHHCTQPLMNRFCVPGTIRASFAFYNTMDEVDQLVTGVKKAVDMLT